MTLSTRIDQTNLTSTISQNELFSKWLTKLRNKWGEVPGAGSNRLTTKHLLHLQNYELCELWKKIRHQDTTNERFATRGWYHEIYKNILFGKKVLDVGSGFGIDGLTFAQHGAHVTCLDLVESNLEILRRLSSKLQIKNISFALLESLTSIESLDNDYDVIWCQGSMINAPFEIAQIEARELLKHLKPDGRWIELAYPQTRWEREGKMNFDKWGEKTDGGAPWIEWYDLEKIHKRLAPTEFETILSFEFHDSDFNWFDLKKKTIM